MPTSTQPRIIILAGASCPWCDRVKQHLRERRFRFREVDVEKDPEGARELKRRNIMGVPVVLINNRPHPEINRTLVELGMVKDIALKDDKVTLTLVLPLLSIPVSIKDYLINSLRQAVMKLGAKIEVRVAEMNQEERLAFLAMERESWRGSA